MGPPMSTKLLSTKGTKDTKNSSQRTSCAFVFLVDKKLRAISWIALLLILAAGCKSTTTTTTTPSNSASKPKFSPAHAGQALSPFDPCPERLHDLAGALLNFMVQYNRLPPTLEDLPPIRGGQPVTLTCPMTNQKYLYNPDGIKFPGNRWAIVYDAAPTHSNYRWAIVFTEPSQRGGAPIPSVLAIPESEFRSATELPNISK